MNYNKVVIVGRVSQAPELRKTPSGQSVTSFGIATNRTWTDKSGQKQENVEFHNVVAWGKLAELSSSYLVKGSLALVEGRLETRSWNDKDGNTRRTTQIVAEGLQFGPRPGTAKAEPVAETKEAEDVPLIDLDDEAEDVGRSFKSGFGDEEEERGEPPF